jgi:acetoacetyl-CoA synthetase
LATAARLIEDLVVAELRQRATGGADGDGDDGRVALLEHDYAGLWSWSVGHLEEFWAAVWTYYNVEASRPYERVLSGTGMPDARWFDGSRLNFARHALRHDGSGPALIEETESRLPRQVSWAELRRQVASAAAGLCRLGVVSGDRVAGYLPNCTEAVVAFLACASIGAIWSCCSAEFGADAALSRFRQIEPKVLIAADRYRYAGVSTGAMRSLRCAVA